jgi:hypothetical protein
VTTLWRRISVLINFVASLELYTVVVIALVTAWVAKRRMRRRVKMDLGETADDNNLLSIQTWMKVDEIEKNRNPGRDWAPMSTGIDYEMLGGPPTLLDMLIFHLKRSNPQRSTQRTQRKKSS